MIRLRITGRGSAWTLELPGPVVHFGRSIDRDIMIVRDAVSRRHGRFFERDGRLRVTDDASTQGTVVNGEIIRRERELGPGDVVEVGGMLLQGEIIEGPTPLTPGELSLLERGSDEPASLLEGVRKSAGLLAAVLSRGETPALVIEALEDCPSPLVLSSVARHPAAPPAVLRRLAYSFGEHVEKNPSLPLLLLEAPDLARLLPRRRR